MNNGNEININKLNGNGNSREIVETMREIQFDDSRVKDANRADGIGGRRTNQAVQTQLKTSSRSTSRPELDDERYQNISNLTQTTESVSSKAATYINKPVQLDEQGIKMAFDKFRLMDNHDNSKKLAATEESDFPQTKSRPRVTLTPVRECNGEQSEGLPAPETSEVLRTGSQIQPNVGIPGKRALATKYGSLDNVYCTSHDGKPTGKNVMQETRRWNAQWKKASESKTEQSETTVSKLNGEIMRETLQTSVRKSMSTENISRQTDITTTSNCAVQTLENVRLIHGDDQPSVSNTKSQILKFQPMENLKDDTVIVSPRQPVVKHGIRAKQGTARDDMKCIHGHSAQNPPMPENDPEKNSAVEVKPLSNHTNSVTSQSSITCIDNNHNEEAYSNNWAIPGKSRSMEDISKNQKFVAGNTVNGDVVNKQNLVSKDHRDETDTAATALSNTLAHQEPNNQYQSLQDLYAFSSPALENDLLTGRCMPEILLTKTSSSIPPSNVHISPNGNDAISEPLDGQPNNTELMNLSNAADYTNRVDESDKTRSESPLVNLIDADCKGKDESQSTGLEANKAEDTASEATERAANEQIVESGATEQAIEIAARDPAGVQIQQQTSDNTAVPGPVLFTERLVIRFQPIRDVSRLPNRATSIRVISMSSGNPHRRIRSVNVSCAEANIQ